MITQPRVLLIDDDRALTFTIELCLKQNGYRFLHCGDGERGLEVAVRELPDLVLLDVILPGIDGVEVCNRLRALNFEPPILMLTGKAMVEDRVTGLNAGADDYLPKPFEPRELVARVQALLRRRQRQTRRVQVIELGPVNIDLAAKTATSGNRPLSLTKTEYALLELLAQNAGKPVSRATMLDVVWGYSRFPTTRTIDTHIWRLRKKLGDNTDPPRWIKPVHGRGYCLDLTG
jgi:DNA-binding response OmpR family regulator